MSKNNRRNFIQKAGALAATAFFSSVTQSTWAGNLDKALRNAAGVSADALSTEKIFGMPFSSHLQFRRALSI